jgi:hypothetical protein
MMTACAGAFLRLRVSKLRLCGLDFWPKAMIHRSLGQRPRSKGAHRLFGRRPYSTCCAGRCEYGLRPKRPDDNVFLGRCPRLRWEQAFGLTRTDAQMRKFDARASGFFDLREESER